MRSLEEISERLAEFRRGQVAAAARAPSPRKRQPHSPMTRKRLREAAFRHHAAQALSDPTCAPLKRARIERGWTLERASVEADVALNTWWKAEVSPERVSHSSWRRFARALRLPVEAIKPE